MFAFEFLCVHVSSATFGNFNISAVARQGAVDLSDQLHVVEQWVEAVEVWEADLMRCAAPRNLEEEEGWFKMQ